MKMLKSTDSAKYELLSCSNEDKTKYVASEKKKECHQTHNQKPQRYMYVFIVVMVFVLLLIYQAPMYTKPEETTTLVPDEEPPLSNSQSFLIFNKKCRIVNIEPYNKEISPYVSHKKYVSCRNYGLLTSLKNVNDTVILRVKPQQIKHYAKNGLSCCYQNIERDEDQEFHDCCIKTSKCIHFINETQTTSPTVMVICKDNTTNKEVYKNVHTVVKMTDEVEKKLQNHNNTLKRPLSILFVGIDSVSRLNLIRSMPKTRSFLVDNEWIELKGYNKIGDNTFPNLMAIFTGKNESVAYRQCNPKKNSELDRCKMIWHIYEKFGFVTAYAEDEASISTFNYQKKGFTKRPVDYYFRPYFIGAGKLKKKWISGLSYCTGPEVSGERVLDTARDFSTFFKGYPSFGMFWMNSFSHNDPNTVSGMDGKIVEFLNDTMQEGILDNTMVIFLSDHGMRFGKIRLTQTGWYEERLPFIYISLPKWFAGEYPEQYKYMQINTKSLTTPYDLHMTLQDLLVFTGFNYTAVPGTACPNCSSLFGPLERDRSCQDAAIASHWCTCKPFTDVKGDTLLVRQSIDFIMEHMRTEILKDDPKCSKYFLKRVLHAKERNDAPKSNSTTLMVVFETEPEAFFEATVSSRSGGNSTEFDFDGNISRLDSYSSVSKCQNDATLKKYCYCR